MKEKDFTEQRTDFDQKTYLEIQDRILFVLILLLAKILIKFDEPFEKYVFSISQEIQNKS